MKLGELPTSICTVAEPSKLPCSLWKIGRSKGTVSDPDKPQSSALRASDLVCGHRHSYEAATMWCMWAPSRSHSSRELLASALGNLAPQGWRTVQLLHSGNMLGLLLAPFLEGFGLTTCREQPGLPAFRTCETKYLKSSATMVRKKLTLTHRKSSARWGRERTRLQFMRLQNSNSAQRYVTQISEGT